MVDDAGTSHEMVPIDLRALAGAAEVNARGARVAALDDYQIGISRFSRHPRWEIHPEADELVQVIDGELAVSFLDGDEMVLGPGQFVVIPKNVWHSPIPHGTVSVLSMSRYEGTRTSDEVDPRE